MRKQKKEHKPHPFVIGQSFDDILRVFKRTGRRWTAVEVITKDSAGEHKQQRAELRKGTNRDLQDTSNSLKLDPHDVIEVWREFEHWRLVFRLTRKVRRVVNGRPEVYGPLIWRVVRIEDLSESSENGTQGD